MNKNTKKILTTLLAFFVICARTGCTQSSNNSSSNAKKTYTVTPKSGGTYHYSISEIIDMKENNGRDFNNKIRNATISGYGRVTNVGPYDWSAKDGYGNIVLYEVEIEIDDCIVLSIRTKVKLDIYNGDTVYFEGPTTGYISMKKLHLDHILDQNIGKIMLYDTPQ